MGLVKRMSSALRLWYHRREIESALRLYKQRTGNEGIRKQAFSESGSFQSQLHRLFTVGNADETDILRDIAERAVNLCITNKYYRPADFLSDIVDSLESRTWLSTDPDGKPPLEELQDHARKAKLEEVKRSWLIPLKVAAVESLMEGFGRENDRALTYQALGRFEREAARLFSLIEEAEIRLVTERIQEFLEHWRTDTRLKARFSEPAEGLRDTIRCLTGETRVAGRDGLRVRRSSQPFRLSTVVPEDRQHLLHSALKRLHPESE